MLTSWKIMRQMNVTWSKGAVPPRFGYFVEGQSNAVGRPSGAFCGRFCYVTVTNGMQNYLFKTENTRNYAAVNPFPEYEEW